MCLWLSTSLRPKWKCPRPNRAPYQPFSHLSAESSTRCLPSEAQSIDPVLPSSTSASATPVASGTKRRRELDHEPDVDPEQKSENEPESAEMWKETSYTPSQRPHGDTEEEQFEEDKSTTEKEEAHCDLLTAR
ncbi:hypothetical protein E3U43_011035 [Larimichthys crocea]|uniref:Uncharacterized protein n=1 Tax=Larimichthys crocea TaxID=215358 RepID=A0ACD3RJ40_LARCR|nr:hypothetical protein E3U43_011035 [Larimichthys crocea]